MKKPVIEIKNIKTMDGRDGYIFSASVYVDGKRSFTAHNDGYGAENWYYPVDDAGKKALERCEEWVKTLPKIESKEFDMTYSTNLDIVLEEIMAETEMNNSFRKKCKKQTLIQLPDYKSNEYIAYKAIFSPRVKELILEKHPEATFINERFI